MKQIGELDITDNKKLVLSIGEYQGSERIDLRQFVKFNGEYTATKRGINFNSEWLDKFVEMVDELKEE
ncbi:unnamed protein product [marine sediment metagenome]|uniref:Transcriptional coactivator p15 (PC4) C-terminal domain-containing protein n=1 Tax=marine sediment metagenome TaxID=412755 RepID=X1SV85_9ZZZZ